jgi:hypothetical protein
LATSAVGLADAEDPRPPKSYAQSFAVKPFWYSSHVRDDDHKPSVYTIAGFRVPGCQKLCTMHGSRYGIRNQKKCITSPQLSRKETRGKVGHFEQTSPKEFPGNADIVGFFLLFPLCAIAPVTSAVTPATIAACYASITVACSNPLPPTSCPLHFDT